MALWHCWSKRDNHKWAESEQLFSLLPSTQEKKKNWPCNSMCKNRSYRDIHICEITHPHCGVDFQSKRLGVHEQLNDARAAYICVYVYVHVYASWNIAAFHSLESILYPEESQVLAAKSFLSRRKQQSAHRSLSVLEGLW